MINICIIFHKNINLCSHIEIFRYAHDPITLHFSLFSHPKEEKNENSNEPKHKRIFFCQICKTMDSLACHSNV